jgi:hypothetical protein
VPVSGLRFPHVSAGCFWSCCWRAIIRFLLLFCDSRAHRSFPSVPLYTSVSSRCLFSCCKIYFSSLDSASAPIRSTGFKPRVRPAVSPARDSSPLVFGSSALGFFDSIGFHLCAMSCPPPGLDSCAATDVGQRAQAFFFSCSNSFCGSAASFVL